MVAYISFLELNKALIIAVTRLNPRECIQFYVFICIYFMYVLNYRKAREVSKMSNTIGLIVEM